jgi:hypothetical protein
MLITEVKNESNIAGRFEFTPLGDASFFKNIFNKENMELMEKWGLAQNTELFKMRFNLPFDLKDLDKFVLDLFNDTNFKNSFSSINAITIPNNEKFIKNFTFKKLSCKSANLDLLDVMYDGKIINKETGKKMIKCRVHF